MASEVDWVEVVDRFSIDEGVWQRFWGKTLSSRCFGWEDGPCDSAIDGLREILDNYPNSSFYQVSLYWYGRRLKVLKRYSEALELLRRYRKEFPGSFLSGEALFDIAECLHEMGRYDEAMETFEEARRESRWNWRGALRHHRAYQVRRPWWPDPCVK